MIGNLQAALAGLLQRYRQISWPARYRLSQLFFNFYFLVMLFFVGIASIVDGVVSIAVKEFSSDYIRRFTRGTILLIEEELSVTPQKHWDDKVRDIDRKYAYNISVVDRRQLKLSAGLMEELDAGETVVCPDGETLYHRLRQTSKILVIGPLWQDSPTINLSWQRGMVPPEFRIRLLVLSLHMLFALFLTLVIWFWVRPVWRDLENLRQTARNLGEGKLASRARRATSKTFALLTETINAMAERIERLIAARKAFSMSISHELRTPIARMRFALEMMKEANGGERAHLLQLVDADIDELDILVESSLVYARYEHHQPEMLISAVLFAPWLEEKVNSIRRLTHTLELSLEIKSIPPDQKVELDPFSMPYAITNLLRNAIKYAKSRIIVSALMDERQVHIHVDDDGVGVPEPDRARVFYPFTRLDRLCDQATGGSGLGLAITRQVLKLHQGVAAVTDSPLLGGARFTLSWPVKQGANTPTSVLSRY